MPRAIDRSGKKYGRLLVIRRAGSIKGRPLFECLCDCGNSAIVRGAHLASGNTKSCGCANHKPPTKHGMCKTPEYISWCAMRTRCNNSNVPSYATYGGRGVSVCKRWDDFTAFLADMGPRPSPKHSIDRIDNNGNYEPGNCRWATRQEQSLNTSRNVRVNVGGRMMSITEIARKTGLHRDTVRARIKRGVADVAAPSRNKRKRRSPDFRVG